MSSGNSHPWDAGQADDESGDFTKRSMLAGEQEFDRLMRYSITDDDENRSDWLSRFLRDSPDVKRVIECVDPIWRATALARLYLPASRYLSQETLLSLISEYLLTLGLSESQDCLHKEWENLELGPRNVTGSQLTTLVQCGLWRAERFWELSHNFREGDLEKNRKALDEHTSVTIGGLLISAEDDGKPIATENLGSPGCVVMKDSNNPKRWSEASLNQIILVATTCEGEDNGYIPSLKEFMNAVCLTYRSFTTAKVFFAKLSERIKSAASGNDADVRMKSANLLKTWVNKNKDSIEERVMVTVRAFVEAELPQFTTSFGLTSATNSQSGRKVVGVPPPVILDERGRCVIKSTGPNLWTGCFTLFDIPPIELARQLTIITGRRFYAIGTNELLDNAWYVDRLKHRAPNACALHKLSDQLSQWVSTAIVAECKTTRERCMRMEYFVELMRILKKMKNFLTLFDIFSGFQSNAVMRLESHKRLFPEPMRDFLKKLEALQSERAKLKGKYKAACQRMQSTFPDMSYFMAIFKCNEWGPWLVKESGHVNLSKMYNVSTIITEFLECTKRPYNFLPVEQIINKLLNVSHVNSIVLEELADDIEASVVKL